MEQESCRVVSADAAKPRRSRKVRPTIDRPALDDIATHADTDVHGMVEALIRTAILHPPICNGPSRFTPDVLTTFLATIRAGHTIGDACRLAGIAPTSYDHWVERARQGVEPYKQFVDTVAACNVLAYDHAVKHFSTEAGKDWKAAERFLARRAKGEWGITEEQTGPPIVVQVGIVATGHPE